MSIRIKKVAVLGSGVMGSGIACHLANVGMDVIMMDLPTEGAKRNLVAESALQTAIKSKPAPLYKAAFAKRIQTGNFDDHLNQIADCDWVIEVIVERADIKKALYEKIEAVRKPGTLITSNTSGIPLHVLAEGRSEDFKKHLCGTHFFNPARYMSLLEIIPQSETDQKIIDFFMHFGDIVLGKKTVLCKDTPAFIANRIGFFSGNKVLELTDDLGLTVTEVDKLTGDAIGWPSTGSFRLLDLVGLDTSAKVTQGVIASSPDDEYVIKMKDRPVPKHMQFLLDNKFLGNKSGQGYYKKTNEKDESGKSIIHALDLQTLEYGPTQKPGIPSLSIAKKIEIMSKRLKEMIEASDKGGQFLSAFFGGLFSYASNRIPEISDNIYSIDDAMKAGYAWSYGPFEYWDMLGFEYGLSLAESQGLPIPNWIYDKKESGKFSFYATEGGNQTYYDLLSKDFELVPGAIGLIKLSNFAEQKPVLKNTECTVHDIGDGVMCLEFTSKANTIGEGIGTGLSEAITLAENGDWKGIVIGNNAKNFSVGANLMAVGMAAMQGDWKTLEAMVDGFQQVNMRMRYCDVPVVIGTQGYVFGGGCEMAMHADAVVASAESYIGLVEVGVGLLPGGGGTKEFALRASDSYFEGDTQIPTIVDKLKNIATASVSTSAHEAFDLGYLLDTRDSVCVGTQRVLQQAKEKVLALSEGYVAPSAKPVTVLGRTGLATLYTAINEYFLGKYMSEHDVEISRKIAYVLCGGDLTGQQQVSEQYLLEIEREAFMQLLGTQKTQERIQYMLMNSKPLRN
ncbi:MAG TPA: 3-hydroxyacyl-CoA dehydrogenase/enoyl-CoA hydratase family protein [Saprospiraceae bacterium]|nr:3-hydroxyacyl-CoA dehydrogenase/enoyl-CoA hydratase family protein [Saprospiraceae bacterium]